MNTDIPSTIPTDIALLAAFDAFAEHFNGLGYSGGDFASYYATKDDFDYDMAECLRFTIAALDLPTYPDALSEYYDILDAAGWRWNGKEAAP